MTRAEPPITGDKRRRNLIEATAFRAAALGGIRPLVLPLFLAMAPQNEAAKKELKAAAGSTIVERATVTKRSELRAFLRMNPEEEFDVESINSLDMHMLLREARADKRYLKAAVRIAEALLPRVRAETEDPLLVGAILTDKTLAWYLKSAADPDWAEFTPLRWGGIFYESRAPGGRLRRKLSTRLVDLINDCVNASGTTAVLRAGFNGMFRGSKQVKSAVQFALGSKRPRLTQQVAQAYLDDLASCPRNAEASVPLAHLSDVAKRNGSTEVNNTLSELFRPENSRSLMVLDPRFHPGMNVVAIQVVPAKNVEEASTYDLVQRETGPIKDAGGAHGAPSEQAFASPWDRRGLTERDWLKILKTLEKRKARLDPPPPENHREQEWYPHLRKILLTDVSARKAFLTVHWKGRPVGLPLLAQLLSQGTWIPEADTDGDYLEAELDHMSRQEGGHTSQEGDWTIGYGWTVTREIRHDGVRGYTARAASAD